MPPLFSRSRATAALLCVIANLTASTGIATAAVPPPLNLWTPVPAEWKGFTLGEQSYTGTLTGDKWSHLRTPADDSGADVGITTTITIVEATKDQRFFGQGWSAWPDATFNDGGFDAGLLFCVAEDGSSGYRVQLSAAYHCVALVKWPEGGYVAVAPADIHPGKAVEISAQVQGGEVRVIVDGQEIIRWRDTFLPLTGKGAGIGVTGGARATFADVTVGKRPAIKHPPLPPHVPRLTIRPFLGGRLFVFDGDEPILQLHNEKDLSCFAKLRPGYKPQLTFDSHWGLENQGAFKEAASQWTAPVAVAKEPLIAARTASATWSARGVNGRFTTRSTLTAGYDDRRGVYTYDITSTLEVLPGDPFHFRYGFDFEHHTPLDPFRWQYLMARREGAGGWYRRPVYPIDPGPQNGLETLGGGRVWYGRHLEEMHYAPAVEYDISPGSAGGRKLNTAVCAAFYDTGVSFPPETAKPGERIEVKYRYTAVPAAEARAIHAASTNYDSPTLDPAHHYIFADEWPRLTFSQHVPMSETWIYGRTPFQTSHNVRPTYALEKNCGAGSGFAMRLGPASFGKAKVAKAPPLEKGRLSVTALVKRQNIHGPGGRIEIEATEAKTGRVLASATHYTGAGSANWSRQGFVFDVPEGAAGLNVAFGNAGTGSLLVTDVEFRPLREAEALPPDVAPRPDDQPSAVSGPSLPGAVADYRMREGEGSVVLNHARGAGAEGAPALGHLDLANLDWVEDSGHRAIRFAENTSGRREYRIDSGLNRHYLSHAAYADKNTLPLALTGHHGGGAKIPGLTLAAWIKPAAVMGAGSKSPRGDVIGYGARRFILSLSGEKAPYRLEARINVNDRLLSDATLDADRWQHVALTAAPEAGQWRVRLYLDGKAAGDALTKQFPADSAVVPSLILGAEIFYFHDAYYRGLIGRTVVAHRVLTATEIATLMRDES